MSVNVISRKEVPGLVSDAIRRIRRKHPEYEARLKKRLAQFCGISLSYADKALRGDLNGYDASLLLNMDAFFDGLLLIELRGGQLSDIERQELITMAKQIEGIARKWTLRS